MRDNVIIIAASDKYSKPHSSRRDFFSGFTRSVGDDINFLRRN
jgi:hypothetical protein